MAEKMSVVTRFAPSPTGFLHIGGARTALFNWLFARHHGGKFLLRIEDTDRQRSTQEAIDAILKGMEWLGLEWDGDAVFQSTRAPRHRECADHLLAQGKAYYCYCSPEELAEMRAKARTEGRPPRYDGRWRNRDPKDAPLGIQPVVRLKAQQEGITTVQDHVQGEVSVRNDQLDDLVLLRADGSPTYMLSVVVDDHDMDITHIIRGDDHFTNTFRQKQIYDALGWAMPEVCHIPLIHGSDGAKLSKRHGALGVEAYRDMGLLPEALCNYLLRLGWSHGDDEIISKVQAIEWFNLENIGKSPARFDMAKLKNLNGHYLRQSDTERILTLITPTLESIIHRPLSSEESHRVCQGMDALKERAKDLLELTDNALIYVERLPYPLDEKALKVLQEVGVTLLKTVETSLQGVTAWNSEALEAHLRSLSQTLDLGLGQLAQPLRAALTGRTVSPSIFEIMVILGKKATLERLHFVLELQHK